MNISIFKTHQQWPLAQKIIQSLQAQGHEAYLAGGCVRDLLIGRRALDLDIATSALPEAVEAAFPNTLAVGKDFGTIVVVEDGQQIEVTSFRSDGSYSDGRHPDKVKFSTLEEDAARRDFTINAMYFDLSSGKVIDLHKGIADLNAKTIRAVGEPLRRFTEDHLRILRAIRFATQLDFEIESVTEKAMVQMSDSLSTLSKERIYSEMEKLCHSKNFAKGIQRLSLNKVGPVILPGSIVFDWQHKELLARCLAGFTMRGIVPLFSLLSYMQWRLHQESEFASLLNDLDWPKKFAKQVNTIANKWPKFLEPSDFYERTLLMSGLDGLILLELWQTHLLVEGQSLQELDDFLGQYKKVCNARGELPKVVITGRELAIIGIKKGPEMGEILREIHRQQIHGKIKTREEALSFARKNYLQF